MFGSSAKDIQRCYVPDTTVFNSGLIHAPFKCIFIPFAKKKKKKFILNTIVFPILYHIINIKITQLSGHIGWNVYSSPELVLEDNGPVLLSNNIIGHLIFLGPAGRLILAPPIQCNEEEEEVDGVQ